MDIFAGDIFHMKNWRTTGSEQHDGFTFLHDSETQKIAGASPPVGKGIRKRKMRLRVILWENGAHLLKKIFNVEEVKRFLEVYLEQRVGLLIQTCARRQKRVTIAQYPFIVFPPSCRGSIKFCAAEPTRVLRRQLNMRRRVSLNEIERKTSSRFRSRMTGTAAIDWESDVAILPWVSWLMQEVV